MNTADRILGAEMSILWLVDREDEDTIWTRVVADGDVPSDQEIKKTDFVSVVRRTDSSQNIVKKTIQSKTVQVSTLSPAPFDGWPSHLLWRGRTNQA